MRHLATPTVTSYCLGLCTQCVVLLFPEFTVILVLLFPEFIVILVFLVSEDHDLVCSVAGNTSNTMSMGWSWWKFSVLMIGFFKNCFRHGWNFNVLRKNEGSLLNNLGRIEGKKEN